MRSRTLNARLTLSVARGGAILLVTGMAAALAGCASEPPAAAEPPPTGNIASEVLPGTWQVVGDTVIFTFDQNGSLLAISNEAHPEDWRTNVKFGVSQRLNLPFGSMDVTLTPGIPVIDASTGEARFDAVGTASNISLGLIPLPGDGHATIDWTGQYSAQTGELTGSAKYEVYYGQKLISADQVEAHTLRKID